MRRGWVSAAWPTIALSDAFRLPRELEHRQAHAVDLRAIGPHRLRREERTGGEHGHVIVLLDAVAADAEAADQVIVHKERCCAGEEDDAVLIRIRRLRALRARIREVLQKQRIERTAAHIELMRADAGREERLRAETDRAIGDRGAGGD